MPPRMCVRMQMVTCTLAKNQHLLLLDIDLACSGLCMHLHSHKVSGCSDNIPGIRSQC
jgi:hypothetical protein